MANNFTELAFSEDVKKEQEKYGSRQAYERMASRGEFRNKITFQEELFFAARDSFYMSSVGKDGWPYMQHRGGPAGFLKVIGNNLLAFADFKGNGQYISAGNLKKNDKTVLFFMDYVNKQRLKVWARTSVYYAEEQAELLDKVKLSGYKAKVERIFTFEVEAFDWNCPKYITQRYTEDEFRNFLS